ncbi:unnamed protein product [Symbiodinium sp. CCMP2592]|nr:unnamed protein product [Symbiodinium sp. CCMP2592]
MKVPLNMHVAPFTFIQTLRQSLRLHTFTSNDGDRLPAIFLVPETISATGRKLQVFVDGTPSCLIQTPLALGGFHHLEVSILGNLLTVRLDGREECEQEVLARTDFPVAAAYAGGPWDAPAMVELRNILYSQENLPAVLPSCEEVRCSLPLPAVPGSDEAAEIDTSSCASARAGAVCTAVACPPGSTLTGRFRCGTDGAWRPEPFADASEVRCAEQLCPRVSPNTSGYATECVDRAVGSTCPLACPAGYLSQSGYQCGETGQWTPIPGAAAPDCTPGPCGEPPALSNAVTPEACRGLPSGGTCPGECQPPWQPLFQYRCSAQRWVEVPLCMPPEMLGINGTTVETVPAVTLSTLLEPSGDLRVFYTLEDWTSLAEGSLQLSMQRLLIQAAPATAPLAVHILGKLAEQDTNTGGRRVQSVAELKPAAWKVQLQLAIVPNELATAAASQAVLVEALPTRKPRSSFEDQSLAQIDRPQFATMFEIMVAALILLMAAVAVTIAFGMIRVEISVKWRPGRPLVSSQQKYQVRPAIKTHKRKFVKGSSQLLCRWRKLLSQHRQHDEGPHQLCWKTSQCAGILVTDSPPTAPPTDEQQLHVIQLLHAFAAAEDATTAAIALDVLQALPECKDSATLDAILEELVSYKSIINRLVQIYLLSRTTCPSGTQVSEIRRLELPGAECYSANPSLLLKEEIAGKLLVLLADCAYQRAETRKPGEAIDHLTRVDDTEVLQEVLVGLESWPFVGISIGWSRILKAETFLKKHVPTEPPAGQARRHDSLQLTWRINHWLDENGHGGNAERMMQQACLRMLQHKSFDNRCLSNLQWGLAHWRFSSISLSYTRLLKAKAFLEWHARAT